MKNNLYTELTERTKQIFKSVVEGYLETGSPSGSETVLKRAGLDISSASVRTILSNLQKEGLLFSPHTSVCGGSFRHQTHNFPAPATVPPLYRHSYHHCTVNPPSLCCH